VRGITKPKLADADLIDIWAYYFEQWGATRADKYIDDIFTAFEAIVGLETVREDVHIPC